MIGVDEARRLVDKRLERLGDDEAPLSSAALLCSGTDVPGPDLVDELRTATTEALVLMASRCCECPDAEPAKFNCESLPVLAGVLNRTFWLGYELGCHADD